MYPVMGCRQVVRQRFLVPPFRRFESFHPSFLKDLSNDKSFLVLFFTHFYLRHLLQHFLLFPFLPVLLSAISKVSINNIPLSIISFPFLFIQNKLKKTRLPKLKVSFLLYLALVNFNLCFCS